MKMNGVEHDMLMPGMLTPEEMQQLANAKGKEFDRLFLQGMIKHHAGAIQMVDELFKSPGAGQSGGVSYPQIDIAVDPLEGTNLVAHGQAGRGAGGEYLGGLAYGELRPRLERLIDRLSALSGHRRLALA